MLEFVSTMHGNGQGFQHSIRNEILDFNSLILILLR